MTAPDLPRRVHLPSGRVVDLAPRLAPGGLRREPGAPLFSEVGRAAEDIAITEGAVPVDVDALELSDFHTLRAILTRSGFVHEEVLPIRCVNCESELSVAPCALLEIGPYKDGELGDDELDRTLPLEEPIDLAGDETVTFEGVTLARARPLHAALGASTAELPRFTSGIVSALGVTALGDEKDPSKIAHALAELPDGTWADFVEAWLRSHYPERLCGIALCPDCGAANPVDAPYERELEPELPPAPEDEGRFPDAETFALRCKEIFDLLEDSIPGDRVMLVVEEGPADCDDGGAPLLGSYLPPDPGGGASPTKPATVTIYLRTFRAMWDDDGPYDWDAEIHETIAHELEHHVNHLTGEDPMDEAERAEIADEAARIVGKKELARKEVRALGAGMGEFVRRTWVLWVVLVLAMAAAWVWRGD